MKRVGNELKDGLKMGLQRGSWILTGGYVVVNLVHLVIIGRISCYLCGGHGRSTELALQRSWYHRLLVGKVKRMMIPYFNDHHAGVGSQQHKMQSQSTCSPLLPAQRCARRSLRDVSPALAPLERPGCDQVVLVGFK